MRQIFFATPGNEALCRSVAQQIRAEEGEAAIRHFPDGESYVRLLSDVSGRHAVVVCTLDHPDERFLPLFFLATALKEQGAAKITLVAPYLAYMRQDKSFRKGELVTSTCFAKILSSFIDELITIDPHLHRRRSMSEIYTIPCKVLHASGTIAQYIRESIPAAVLIGPDSESEQWVSEVAEKADVPYIVLNKERKGDREVTVSLPVMEKYAGHTPVVLDDIVSTAQTMIETVHQLLLAGMKPPVCIGVHPIFAASAYDELKSTGVSQILSCNTIVHPSNKIDVSKLISDHLIAEENGSRS